MTDFSPLRQISQKKNPPLTINDTIVIIGEVFQRGYVNGIIDEATRCGAQIFYTTVGRRSSDLELRPLTQEEITEKNQNLINIPLEAGFDLELSSSGKRPVDFLKDCKLSDWKNCQVDWQSIEESRKLGEQRLRLRFQELFQTLETQIKPRGRIIFAHIMAGGVPRAKIIMPLMNRVFKGRGDRFLPSIELWDSNIGKLTAMSFEAVSADSFEILIQESDRFRKLWGQNGGSGVQYLAYGYHGTEIEFANNLTWQSYSPYLQGWAKVKLESIAEKYFRSGIQCAVYNCPEILTNSSSIFQGVEVPLYPLLRTIKKYCTDNTYKQIWQQCKERLHEQVTDEQIFKICDEFLSSEVFQNTLDFKTWPSHSEYHQMQNLLQCSDALIALHLDEKNLITQILSEIVFKSCGQIMINDIFDPQKPVRWIGHDLVATTIPNT